LSVRGLGLWPERYQLPRMLQAVTAFLEKNNPP
jgi:hypothetical protein